MGMVGIRTRDRDTRSAGLVRKDFQGAPYLPVHDDYPARLTPPSTAELFTIHAQLLDHAVANSFG